MPSSPAEETPTTSSSLITSEDFNEPPGSNEESDYEYFKSASNFNILPTNARSLIPKIDCCVEYFKELETTVAFLTETWLLDSPELKTDIEDLELETGYSMLYKNRPPNDRGYSAGGVAIAFKKSSIVLKEITMADNAYEMLFTVGTIPNCLLYTSPSPRD